MNLVFQSILKDSIVKLFWFRSVSLGFVSFRFVSLNIISPLEEVEEAVRAELNGPGKLLGYRALHKKIREVHQLKVPRDVVYAMMEEVDPTGLQERAVVGKAKRRPRTGVFSSQVSG